MHTHTPTPHTQFERSFPGPPDISSTDITGLALHYADPNTGLCNYLLFHHDIERLASNKGVTTQSTQPVNTTTTANVSYNVCVGVCGGCVCACVCSYCNPPYKVSCVEYL